MTIANVIVRVNHVRKIRVSALQLNLYGSLYSRSSVNSWANHTALAGESFNSLLCELMGE